MEKATRLRDLKESARDQLMIDPRIIKVQKGFNPRDYRLPENRAHLDELKASIRERGTLVPLLVRFDADEGAAYLVDGECRLRANLELIKEGVDIKAVPTVQVPSRGEDASLFDALIANTGKPLSKWEAGNAFHRLFNFGHSEEDISKKTGFTVRYIKEAMELANASDEIKYLLSEQAVTPSLAIAEIRKSPTGAVMVLRQRAEEAKAAGQKTAKKKIQTPAITVRTLVHSLLGDLADGELENTENEYVSVKRTKLKKLVVAVGADRKELKGF